MSSRPHTCSVCQLGFGKAEHLLRHERSHTKERPFACPTCNKLFTRRDSLSRHVRLHNPGHRGRSFTQSPLGARQATGIEEADPSASTSSLHQSGRGSLSPPPRTTLSDRFGLAFDEETPESPDNMGIELEPSMASPADRGQMSVSGLQVNPSSSSSTVQGTTLQPVFEDNPGAEIPFSFGAMGDGMNEDFDLLQLLTNNILPFSQNVQPSPRFPGSETVSSATAMPPGFAPTWSEDSSMAWGSYSALSSTSKANNTLAGPSSTGVTQKSKQKEDAWAGSAARGQEAVNEAHILILDLSSRLTNESSPLSASFLDLSLRMFFTRFLPMFPVIHQPTFNVRNTIAPLLLNMIAIGSLSLANHDARAKGRALWRLVHKGVAGSWDQLVEHRGRWDPCKGVQLVMTALLGQLYATMSSDPDLRRTSDVFRAMGFRWARAGGSFDPSIVGAVVDLPPAGNSSHEALTYSWHLWVGLETQRRAIVGHYILDGHITHLFDFPTTTKHLANPYPLLADDATWGASTAEAWADCIRSKGPSMSFAELFTDLFSARPFVEIRGLAGLTYATLLEGLLSLVTETRETPNKALGNLELLDMARAFTRVYTGLWERRDNDRVALLMRWHVIAISLLECNHDPTEGLPEVRRTRLIFLHANAIRQLAEDLSFSSLSSPHFSIPYSVYKASTTLVKCVGVNFDTMSTLGKSRYSLEHHVDWPDLLQHGWDVPTWTDVDMTPERSFVVQGAEVTIDGAAMGYHDLLSLATLLQAFGKTWDAAATLADDLASQLVK